MVLSHRGNLTLTLGVRLNSGIPKVLYERTVQINTFSEPGADFTCSMSQVRHQIQAEYYFPSSLTVRSTAVIRAGLPRTPAAYC
jgi:hypothetical protein